LKENLEKETLAKQFGIVKRKTTKSHVLNFGNLNIEQEHVSEFMGDKESERSMGSGLVGRAKGTGPIPLPLRPFCSTRPRTFQCTRPGTFPFS
jgi:hypothetical protein